MFRTRAKLLLRLVQAACRHPHECAATECSCTLIATDGVGVRGLAGISAPGHLQHGVQQQQQHCQQQQLRPAQHLPSWHAIASCSSGSISRHSSSLVGTDNSTNGGGEVGGSAAVSARPRDMAIVFTCAKCETRSVKAFTRQAYEHGLVLITCPGCQAMHLIADHLGWFGDSGFKIDEYLASLGQQVKRVSINTQQEQQDAARDQQQPAVTAEDIAGWSKVQQLLSTVAAAAGGTSSSSKTQNSGCSGHDASQEQEGRHDSSGSSSTTTGAVGSSSAQGAEADSRLKAEMAAAAAKAANDTGVVDVSPEDVQSWVRVQQQQQYQQ